MVHFIKSYVARACSVVLLTAFITTGAVPPSYAQLTAQMPEPSAMLGLSAPYQPIMIKGLSVDRDNPFMFDFIMEQGQEPLAADALKKEGEKLIRYFLASLAISEKDQWVNLSPYEKEKLIPEALGVTELGRDLLVQDYILKQITSALTDPNKELGKEFWNRVHLRAQELYGTEDVPMDTFNKVWIMADRAEVFEQGNTAFVVDSHLKVLLEQDYVALKKNPDAGISEKAAETNAVTAGIIRDVILPELEKEVNTGKNFSNLRQMFNAIILAGWFKNNVKQALLNQVYTDRSTVTGIDLKDTAVKQRIYEQYLAAFQKGAYNFIKEEMVDGELTPRKYFSGGLVVEGTQAANPVVTHDAAKVSSVNPLVRFKTGIDMNSGVAAKLSDESMLTVNGEELAAAIATKPLSTKAIAAFFPQGLKNIYDPENGIVKVVQVNGKMYKSVDVAVALMMMRENLTKGSQVVDNKVQVALWEEAQPYSKVYTPLFRELSSEIMKTISATSSNSKGATVLENFYRSELESWRFAESIRAFVADSLGAIMKEGLALDYEQKGFSDAPESLAIRSLEGNKTLSLVKFTDGLSTDSEPVSGYGFTEDASKLVKRVGTYLGLTADDQVIYGKNIILVHNKATGKLLFLVSPNGKGLVAVSEALLSRAGIDMEDVSVKSVALEGELVNINGGKSKADLRGLMDFLKAYALQEEHEFSTKTVKLEKTGEEEITRTVPGVFESRWSDTKQWWPEEEVGTGVFTDVIENVAYYEPIEVAGKVQIGEFSHQVMPSRAYEQQRTGSLDLVDSGLESADSKDLTALLAQKPISPEAVAEYLSQDTAVTSNKVIKVNGHFYKGVDVLVALRIIQTTMDQDTTKKTKGIHRVLVTKDGKYVKEYIGLLKDVATELESAVMGAKLVTKDEMTGLVFAERSATDILNAGTAARAWVAEQMTEIAGQPIVSTYVRQTLVTAPATITLQALGSQEALTLQKFTDKINEDSEPVAGYAFGKDTKKVVKDGTYLNLGPDDQMFVGKNVLAVHNAAGKVSFYVSPTGQGLVSVDGKLLDGTLTWKVAGEVRSIDTSDLVEDLNAISRGYSMKSVELQGDVLIVRGEQISSRDGEVEQQEIAVDLLALSGAVMKEALVEHAFDRVTFNKEVTGQEEIQEWVEAGEEISMADTRSYREAGWEGTGRYRDVYGDVPSYTPIEVAGRISGKVDSASKDNTVSEKKFIKGGIDLDTAAMKWIVRKDGQGVEVKVDPAMVQRILTEGVNSLSPVIIKIEPVMNIRPLLGLEQSKGALQA